MASDDILHDIQALEAELRCHEQRFGMRAEGFYRAYCGGEEPPDAFWARDWAAWASGYQLLLRRRRQVTGAFTS